MVYSTWPDPELFFVFLNTGNHFWFFLAQFDPLSEENMKAILVAEKKADDIEKRLTENLEELQGIEKVEILIRTYLW